MIIIVNADDLGANEQVNDEIFDLIQSGDVTSATLMANAPGFEHAIKKILHFPKCSFGVHLNLTAFSPLSDSRSLKRILDENGNLSKKLFNVRINSSLREALFQELRMQVQRVIDAGVPISHFDSHNHVHTIPKLFPVLKSLQRTFTVRKVRTTISLLPQGQQMAGMRSLKKLAFRVALRHLYKTTSPDGLGDFREFYKLLKAGGVPKFHVLELMVHPGIPTPKYADEVSALRSDWRNLLQDGMKTGNYHSI